MNLIKHTLFECFIDFDRYTVECDSDGLRPSVIKSGGGDFKGLSFKTDNSHRFSCIQRGGAYPSSKLEFKLKIGIWSKSPYS